MSTHTWTVTDTSPAEGMSLLAEPPIAEGTRDDPNRALRAAFQAVTRAADAAGLSVVRADAFDQDDPDNHSTTYLLSDGSRLHAAVAQV